MTKELLQQCLDALKSCRNVDQQWQIFDPQKVLKAVTDITVALAQQEQRSPNESELAALKADAWRYKWLKQRLLCADFSYGDPSEACNALVFEIPEDMRVSADIDSSIDAMKGAT